MTTKPENPAAFPSANDVKVGPVTTHGHPGMTLRDYFAAAALQGLLANEIEGPSFETMQDHERHYATISFGYADAMLAAREAAHD